MVTHSHEPPHEAAMTAFAKSLAEGVRRVSITRKVDQRPDPVGRKD